MQTLESSKTISSTKAKPEPGQPFFGPLPATVQEGGEKVFSAGNRSDSPAFFSAHPRPVIQPKLTINEPGDQYEQEADAMAERVMRMTSAPPGGDGVPAPAGSPPVPFLQRKCAACEEEEKVQRQEMEEEEPVQAKPLMRKATGGGYTATPQLQSQLNSSKGGGNPLPGPTLTSMSQAFGADFSQVRIHTDARAAEMSQGIQAKAFTHGADIYFNQGQYSPESGEGRRLLGHELGHVVQRNGTKSKDERIMRKPIAEESYRDCNKDTTFRSDSKKELEFTLDRARDFVDVAESKLRWDYTKYRKGESYRVAMEIHFASPDTAERKTIRSNYIKIRDKLTPNAIRCVLNKVDTDYCYSMPNKLMLAFFKNSELYLCPNFWMQDRNCRAITLIHEAAHAIGLGISPHPPYRGSSDYPFGSGSPSPTQSASIRMKNPDPYGYFAAHIWREIDTECKVLNEIIIVS